MTYSDSDTVSTTSTASSADGVNCRHGLVDSYDLDITYDLEHMQHQGNINEADEEQHQHGCYIDNISRLNPSYTVDSLYRLYPATDMMEEEMAYQNQLSTIKHKKKNDDGIITGSVIVQVDLEQPSTAAAAAAAAAMVSVALTSTTTDFQSLLSEEILDLRNQEKQKRLMLGVMMGIATTTMEDEEQQQPAKKKRRFDYTDSPSRLFATRIPEDDAITPLVIPVSFMASVEVEEEEDDDDEVGDEYDAFSTVTISPSTISEDESVAPPVIPVSDIHSITNGEEEVEGDDDDDDDVDEDDNIPTTSSSSLAAISEEDKDVVAPAAAIPVSNSSIAVHGEVDFDVNVIDDDDDIPTSSTSSLPVISEEEEEVVAPSATIPVSVSFIAVNDEVVGNIDDEVTAAMVAVASKTENEAAPSTLPTGSDTSSFNKQVTATLYNKNSTMSDEEKNKRIVDLLRCKYGDKVATSYNTKTSTATSQHNVWCDFVCEHRIQFQDVSNNDALYCEDALMDEAEMNYDYSTHSFEWWWNPLDNINTNNQRMPV